MTTFAKLLGKWKSYLGQDVANDLHVEIQLLMLTIATGIMDAVTFPDFKVFASNQTGNTALLAVGALQIDHGYVDLANVSVSLCCFVGGGFAAGQLGTFVGPRRRWWLLLTHAIQTTMVFLAAALRYQAAGPLTASVSYGIIALLAIASGAQVAFARTIDVPEITTAMVTSAYIDLLTDPALFDPHNRPRNRRLLFIAYLIVGSFLGAIAYRYSAALALLISGCVKFVVLFALLLNPKEHQDRSAERLSASERPESGHDSSGSLDVLITRALHSISWKREQQGQRLPPV